MMDKGMSKKFSLLLLVLISSCGVLDSGKKTRARHEIVEVKEYTLQPGMVKLVDFNIPSDMTLPKLSCKDKEVQFYSYGKKGMAYLSENYFSEKNDYDCYLIDGSYKEQVLSIKISEYEYPSEKLRVNRGKVVLSKKDLARVIKEVALLKEVYANSSHRPYFEGPFRTPLESKITSKFGTRRLYNSVKKGQHLGIDFRAPVGKPIPNANRGKVVFSGDLFYTGNTVIVDHGMSIFTIYAHLSKISVKEDQIADKGDIIGLAGMTGRVSGPHLHWGVKVQGDRVSGFSLIEASKDHFSVENEVKRTVSAKN
jgi:murein DD-endopeptidase MepM/ murein hydrolase activator NlpD